LQENEISEKGTAPTFSLEKAITAPLQKWAARYNAPMNADDTGYEIAVDDSGYVYVAGKSLNPDSNYDGVAIKYDKDGKLQWLARYNSLANHNDAAYALAVDDSGNVYIGGYTLNADFNNDFVTVKYNRNGVRQWVARYNGPGNWHDGIFDLQLDAAGNVYVIGYSYARRSPNTTISFALPTVSRVKLAIYNLNGKLVHTLADGEMSAGYHHLNFDASGLAAGVYFYRLDAGAYSAARKMILQK